MARRAGNKLFKCDSITIPITGPASDKNYPPTKVDKGSGGVNDALCDRRRKGEPSRIGSDRIGSGRVGSGRVARSGIETRAVLSENYGMVGEAGRTV